MMDGTENGHAFDPSFGAYFQAPHSASPSKSLSQGSPSAYSPLGLPEGNHPAFLGGLSGGGAPRPGSAGGPLSAGMSSLSVNSVQNSPLSNQFQIPSQPQAQPHRGAWQPERHNSLPHHFPQQADFHASGSSPHSRGASPGSELTQQSPSMRGKSAKGFAGVEGMMMGSQPHKPHRLSNLSGSARDDTFVGLTDSSPTMQRYASSTGENNSAESPISNAAGASSMGNDASDQGVGDDSGLQAQTEAEIAAEKRQSSKFVYKLFRMVSDQDYQHLISWNRNGTSVMVCNFDEFAKEVLGKHFKHSNFSSFIRQLNMYGFYKVNKTPRGHRQSVDTQIWEFSHPKFLRGRPELLEDIRRKALDSEHARVEARDLQYSVSVGQMQLRQQVEEIQFRLDETMEQNLALRNFTTQLRDTMSQILDHIKKTNGGRLPFEANIPTLEMPSPMPHSGMWGTPFHDGPPIFVTEPEFGVGGMVPGVRHPSEFSGNDPFATSLPGSRRVSQGSSQGEAMTPMGGGSASGDQSLGPNGPIGPPVFGHGPRGPFGDNGGSPQHAGMHGMGRPIAGKPGLSGLAIDTSAASSPQLYQSGVSPTSAGLTASNAGLGVGMMSLPPSPLTPQHQAMMAAINTPLPPSPAPGSTNGGQFHSFDPGNSPYMHSPSVNHGHFVQPGLPVNAYAAYGGGGVMDEATTTTAVDDMLGPNSKAMRTPMKRTASNSHSTAAGFKGTPTMNSGMSTPSSPGSMKRKSPI